MASELNVGGINGTLGATTPATVAATTISAAQLVTITQVANNGQSLLVKSVGTGGGDQPLGTFERSDAAVRLQLGYDGDTGHGYLGTTTAHDMDIRRGGSLIGKFTSTGLAVTGAVTATTLSTFSSGIAFTQTGTAATGAATTSSTLDHYEEGTWTPDVRGSTSGVKTAGAANQGSYTRVGNVCSISGTIAINGSESLVGLIQLGGLPFASAAGNRSAGTLAANNGAVTYTAGYNNIKVNIDGSNTEAYIIQLATDGTGYNHNPVVSSADRAIYGFQMTYNV
jgi:hypothetical protein